MLCMWGVSPHTSVSGEASYGGTVEVTCCNLSPRDGIKSQLPVFFHHCQSASTALCAGSRRMNGVGGGQLSKAVQKRSTNISSTPMLLPTCVLIYYSPSSLSLCLLSDRESHCKQTGHHSLRSPLISSYPGPILLTPHPTPSLPTLAHSRPPLITQSDPHSHSSSPTPLHPALSLPDSPQVPLSQTKISA